MCIVIGITAAILVLIALLLCVPVRIRLFFSYTEGKPVCAVHAGLGKLQINLSRIVKKDTGEKRKKNTVDTQAKKQKLTFEDFENILSKAVDALQYLKKKFTVKLFLLHVRMALGDASDTGIAAGAAYASVYTILGTIDRYFILKKHEVVITPVFKGVGLEMEFRGEFQLRIVYCLGLINKLRKGDVL